MPTDAMQMEAMRPDECLIYRSDPFEYKKIDLLQGDAIPRRILQLIT